MVFYRCFKSDGSRKHDFWDAIMNVVLGLLMFEIINKNICIDYFWSVSDIISFKTVFLVSVLSKILFQIIILDAPQKIIASINNFIYYTSSTYIFFTDVFRYPYDIK